MLDDTNTERTGAIAQRSALPAADPAGGGRMLARALDELDYGVALLAADASVLHLNHRGRQAFAAGGALQLLGMRLRAGEAQDVVPLHDALQAVALRGLRRLLVLGSGAARQIVAVVPVEPGAALLVLGRSHVCEDLSMSCFARAHDLTSAETRVLSQLAQGESPHDIARRQGVKLSTVRTQIAAIRSKTASDSITSLVRLVAGLPPMVGVLRH